MSTIREIARELNLSHTTVSRVLNTRNEQAIPLTTRDRIWETARRMGYRPHAAARALATGRTNLIALMMRHLYTSFHAQVVHEVERTARQSGYQVLVATVDWNQDTPEAAVQGPWQVDGYLAFETGTRVSAQVALAQGRGKATPVVAMGGHHLGDGPDQVGFDLAAGTDAAMAHLLESGRRRIVHVSDVRKDVRRERYEHALREAGLPAEIIALPSQQRGDARSRVHEILSERLSARRGDLPDALFCFNDEIAIGTFRAVRELGLRVPEDIAIIGFDGIEDAAYQEVPLTTVVLPVAEMCRLSWEILQRRLADPEAEPSRTMLRPTLLVRKSTRGSAVAARSSED